MPRLGTQHNYRTRYPDPSHTVADITTRRTPFFPKTISDNTSGYYPVGFSRPNVPIHAIYNVKTWRINASFSVSGSSTLSTNKTLDSGTALSVATGSSDTVTGTAIDRNDLLDPDTNLSTSLTATIESGNPPFDTGERLTITYNHTNFVRLNGTDWHPNLRIDIARTSWGSGGSVNANGSITAALAGTPDGTITWLSEDIPLTATGDPLTGTITITEETPFQAADW